MSATTITVHMDLSAIEGAYDDAAIRSAQTQFMERVATDSNRYCKWDTGATWESMATNSDMEGGIITWSTPYAAEAYNNPTVGTHPTNPNGKTDPHPQWFEHAKSVHLQQWVQLAKHLLGGS